MIGLATGVLGLFPWVGWLWGGLLPPEMAQPASWTRRLAELRHDCDSGKPQSCMVLANLYSTGQLVVEDDAQAAAFWARACDIGGPIGVNGCFRRADHDYRTVLGREIAQKKSIDAAQRLAEAAARVFDAREIELASKLCDQGLAAACAGLARTLAEPLWGRPADSVRSQALSKRAAALAQTACAAGNRESCTDLESYLSNGADAEVDERRAVESMKHDCSAGDPIACAGWARWNEGKLIRQERSELTEAEILGFHLKACDAGSTDACARAAARLRYGLGGAVDLKTSLRLYEDLCFTTGESCEEMIAVQAETGASKP